jgi:uncharacterized surface protein with fasciclin (FAS1) repeats
MKVLAALCLALLAASASANKGWTPVVRPPTVWAAVEATPEFSTLAAVINAADPIIKATLSDPWLKATVFAPTNDAFAQLFRTLGLDQAGIDALLANQKLITEILLNHVVRGVIPAAHISRRPRHLESLLGGYPGSLIARRVVYSHRNQVVTIKSTGNKVESAVLKGDIRAGRSIVHAINYPLIPGEKKVW